MADPKRRKPPQQEQREGKPGKRAARPGVVLPAEVLLEPDWSDTFLPFASADNARCASVASEEWRRVVPVLHHSVGLGIVDITTLRDYCICVARIDQCERELSTNGLLQRGERGMQKNGATTIVGQYRQQLARYIGELGLSPSARGRLQPPESDADDDSDIWD